MAAGEQAGILETLLDRLANYKEKMIAIRSKIKAALFYPVAIIVVAFIITAVIMIFVIPSFKEVFKSFGADLPTPTLIVIGMSDFVVAYWWALFGGIGGAIFAFFYTWKRSEAMQIAFDRIFLRLPVFGDIIRKSVIARWTRTLATMFAAGVPLVESLESVGGAAGNYVYKAATRQIESEVSTGTSLTVAMQNAEVFPTMVVQMVSSGEGLGKENDVQVAALEHKMGINGSATCILNFGDNDACISWPVGGETKINQGMPQMFVMMNAARISVGVQGLSVASAAYLNALEYAKDRKQGASMTHWKDPTAPRVSIIEHADVRRMLLDMKGKVEGLRALALKLTQHQDQVTFYKGNDDAKAAYHQGQVDLLVPLMKAYGSDQGFRVCETAIQTYGGAGYTRDYPVEQYCRDAKIFSIYEGTNHIQAMDLVGRKLGQAGGANFQAFMGDVQKFVTANASHPTLGAEVKRLGAAAEPTRRNGGVESTCRQCLPDLPQKEPARAERRL